MLVSVFIFCAVQIDMAPPAILCEVLMIYYHDYTIIRLKVRAKIAEIHPIRCRTYYTI